LLHVINILQTATINLWMLEKGAIATCKNHRFMSLLQADSYIYLKMLSRQKRSKNRSPILVNRSKITHSLSVQQLPHDCR